MGTRTPLQTQRVLLTGISERVQQIWRMLNPLQYKTSLVSADEFIIKDSEDNGIHKLITAATVSSMMGSGGGISGRGYWSRSSNSELYDPYIDEDAILKEWTEGKDYEPRVITRDSDGRVTTMTVKWPDDSTGIYTATNYNGTHEVYDGYTVSHTDRVKTVIQTAVTRNVDGAVINKPALIIT
jgi:hypothetical protein